MNIQPLVTRVNPYLISVGIPAADQIRSYLLRSGSHFTAAGQSVHEPVSEVLADHREGRGFPGRSGHLRGRFRDPESRLREAGIGVDAAGDDPDWTHSERSK